MDSNNSLEKDRGVLAGVRVLDLTRLLPGPVTTWMLRRLGAEVIKVESPKVMDYLRFTPPLVDGMNPTYRMLNEGKRHIVLDLKNDSAREAIFQLLENIDILVEQYRPGVLAKLGLDASELRKRFPRLIIASITGFGQTGPYAKRAGHDLNYQAASGLLSRYDGTPATTVPAYQPADVTGGSYYATLSILAALLGRSTSGEGRHLDISMTEGALPVGALGLATAIAGKPEDRVFNSTLQGDMACYNIYECKDGRALVVAALEPKFWISFCEAVGHPEWIEVQTDFSQGSQISAELAEMFAQEDAAFWIDKLQEVDCCVELVALPEEIPEHPQHKARKVLVEGPCLRLPGIEISGTSVDTRQSDLRLGAETRAVLEESGINSKEIDALIKGGAAIQAS